MRVSIANSVVTVGAETIKFGANAALTWDAGRTVEVISDDTGIVSFKVTSVDPVSFSMTGEFDSASPDIEDAFYTQRNNACDPYGVDVVVGPSSSTGLGCAAAYSKSFPGVAFESVDVDWGAGTISASGKLLVARI